MGEKAFVDSVEIPNSKTSIIHRLAEVFPWSKGYRWGRVVFVDAIPPKYFDNGIDLTYKSIRKGIVDM
jgi:hypothetical protein